MNFSADVLIVTATKTESKAIVEIFRNASGRLPEPVSIGNRMYQDLGIINGARIFMVQSEMGTSGLGGSLMTVQNGITALSPTAVIMTGIAFGINPNKQSIGDILVSQRLMVYELQRVGTTAEGKPVLIPRGDRPHASPWLLDRFRSADMYWNESNPKVQFGLILSGEKLVDNIDFREQLHQFEAEAIGGEMEGAGLYAACQNSKVDWIIVKSICDWADGNKSQNKDVQQQLAAKNAANFVLHVLQHAPLRQDEKQRALTSSVVQADRKTAQVTILLDRELHEFTPDEQTTFIFALSRIVNISPDQIKILRVTQGSVLLTVELPEEAAILLIKLFMQQSFALQSLQVTKVELKQKNKIAPISKEKPSLASILFLAADPTNASRLRLGAELREIQEKLQLSRLREQFALQQRLSLRPADISQALLDVQPNIVHFSGHGAPTGELYFENQIGEMKLVSPDALSALFEQFSDKVDVVILNACYSETQANAIAEHINYVIGMNRDINDEAAIAFSVGFYQALGAGRTVDEAYKLGLVQIRLQGMSEHQTPVLIKKGV